MRSWPSREGNGRPAEAALRFGVSIAMINYCLNTTGAVDGYELPHGWVAEVG
jgi:hypothetical protein